MVPYKLCTNFGLYSTVFRAPQVQCTDHASLRHQLQVAFLSVEEARFHLSVRPDKFVQAARILPTLSQGSRFTDTRLMWDG